MSDQWPPAFVLLEGNVDALAAELEELNASEAEGELPVQVT